MDLSWNLEEDSQFTKYHISDNTQNSNLTKHPSLISISILSLFSHIAVTKAIPLNSDTFSTSPAYYGLFWGHRQLQFQHPSVKSWLGFPQAGSFNGWGEGVQSRRRWRDGGSFLGKFGLLTFSPLLVFFCLVRVERQVQAEQDREWIIHEKTEIVIFVLNSN